MNTIENHALKALCAPLAVLLAAMPTFALPAAAQPAEKPLYALKTDAFAGKPLEQMVRELADREELRELIATYAHRVAHGASIADLFTDDGAFINIRPGMPISEARGRKALEARFADRPADAEHALPMIHNYLFEIRGDEARGLNSNELRITENGNSIIASGHYEDRYRRENGRWRFVERRITFSHWVPIQQGWARPAAQD